MNNQFSEENIERIQQYLSGSLSDSAKTTFEAELVQDEALQKLLADYKLMQEGFELSELQKKRNRLKNIKALAEEEVKIEQEATVRELPGVSYRRLLSYAAMLIPGLLLGWLFFNNNGGNQSIGGGNFGGNIDDAVVLYDQSTSLLKVYQNNLDSPDVPTTIIDTSQVTLIISEMETPQIFYSLADNVLEVILDKKMVADDNLGEASIHLIIEKLDKPKVSVALLEINQRIFQIPLTNEDFNALFN